MFEDYKYSGGDDEQPFDETWDWWTTTAYASLGGGDEKRGEETAQKTTVTEESLPESRDLGKQPRSATPLIAPPLPRQKKFGRMRFAVTLAAVCMLGSAVFGFGGTYLANSFSEANLPHSNEPNIVIYQSVLRTNATGGIAGKMSIEDVVINAKHSVVEIKTETVSTSVFMRQFVSTGAGSGVIITADGYIVTNNHVVDGAQTITVRLSDGREYKATLIGTDAKTDLAVIKIDAEGLPPAVLGYSSELLIGQSAIAIGNPLGELGGTVTAGIISALDREITIDGETMSLLQTDTAINPGNSGGGLFNLYGELVGIVNAKSSGSEIEGLGFAIPIDTAKEVIRQLIDYGYVRGRIDTGLTLVDIQDSFTAMSYRINQLGLYISSSVNHEFQSGDRITAVDGRAVNNLADWNKLINLHSVGDAVNVTVVRGGSGITVPLTLTEMIA